MTMGFARTFKFKKEVVQEESKGETLKKVLFLKHARLHLTASCRLGSILISGIFKGLSTGSELQWGNWVQHEFQLQATVVPTRKIILKLPKGQRKRTTTKTKRRLFIAYKHNVI